MRKSFIGWVATLLLCHLGLQGQLTLSPYSRYGLGELTETNSIRNISMGGISAGLWDASSINRLNPASYADIRLTTMDISGYLGTRLQKTAVSNGSTSNGGLYNLSFAFSNNKAFGFAFGISPGSTVGYRLALRDSVLVDSSYEAYTTNYQASGGLNHFYLGAGVRLLRTFRVGVNATYNFGTLDYTWQNNFDDQNYYTGNILKRVTLRGWTPQVGVQFADTLNIKSQVDRLKELEHQHQEALAEVNQWKREQERIQEGLGEKNAHKAQQDAAKITALREEQKALRTQVDALMQNEEANEKEIGKLQDKTFRLERKARNLEKNGRGRDRLLTVEMDRAKAAEAKAQAKADGLARQMEEVKAGKLPAEVEKRRSMLVRLGGTVQPSGGLKGTRLLEFNNTNVIDSAGPMMENKVTVPLMYTAGFAIGQPNRWTLGADLRMQDWGAFQFFDEDNTMGSSLRIGLGGEWIPKYYDQKYARRIAYRIGGFYHRSNIIINGEPLQEYGVTIGTGLPIGRYVNETQTISRLNLGVTLSRSGNLAVQPLQETSIRLILGLNLNDVWFRKWRLD